MPRKVCKVHVVLTCCLLVAGAKLCAAAISNPPIARLDVFIGVRYDANTVLIFFNSTAMPGKPGVPARPWPSGAAAVWVANAPMQLAPSGEEQQWVNRWPGGADFAPRLGEGFVLALGGGTRVRGIVSNLGYLPVCNMTWLVGLVSVNAADRAMYASAATEGMAAYPATEETLRASAKGQQAASAAVATAANERILNTFPLAALPMLDQAADDHESVVLTEERDEGRVLYSLKRQTAGNLLPTGVYFANGCPVR